MTELLAPAGSIQAFEAAINAGADAVYVGGAKFGAREYATNFSEEELVRAIKTAHLHGVKVYLTVNTILKGRELSMLPAFLTPYYKAGLDAVLVQDIGVLSVIREAFPYLPIHASTQMSICDVSGARLLKELGVSRIVCARELSLNEIIDIKEKADIEVETFVHGAMCYSYSGQCLMSSILGGRSGNRGRCAGTCRLPFDKDGSGKNVYYPLSMKDLCTIEILPELVDAGISSLKIEGRMKSPAYVAGVTSIYRKYLDRCLSKTDFGNFGNDAGNGAGYRVSDEDRRALLDLGNRSGFTKGYYHKHNGTDMLCPDSPSHTNAGEDVLSSRYSHLIGGIKKKIYLNADLICKKNEKIKLILESEPDIKEGKKAVVEVCGIIPDEAQKRPIDISFVTDKINALGDTGFEFKDLNIDLDDGLFVTAGELKGIRRQALSMMEDEYVKKSERREEDIRDIADTKEGSGICGYDGIRTYIRVRDREQLGEVIRSGINSAILFDEIMYDTDPAGSSDKALAAVKNDMALVREAGCTYCFVMPRILRTKYEKVFSDIVEYIKNEDAFVYASSFDSLYFLNEKGIDKGRVLIGGGLYTMSDRAVSAYDKMGYKCDIIPYELNKKELMHRKNAASILPVYGRIALMYSANCVHAQRNGCDKKKTVEMLKDRKGKCFPVANNCDLCLNTTYNSDVLCLFNDEDEIKKTGAMGRFLDFTFESKDEVKEVLLAYKEKRMPEINGYFYTKGHFNRGVE